MRWILEGVGRITGIVIVQGFVQVTLLNKAAIISIRTIIILTHIMAIGTIQLLRQIMTGSHTIWLSAMRNVKFRNAIRLKRNDIIVAGTTASSGAWLNILPVMGVFLVFLLVLTEGEVVFLRSYTFFHNSARS